MHGLAQWPPREKKPQNTYVSAQRYVFLFILIRFSSSSFFFFFRVFRRRREGGGVDTTTKEGFFFGYSRAPGGVVPTTEFIFRVVVLLFSKEEQLLVAKRAGRPMGMADSKLPWFLKGRPPCACAGGGTTGGSLAGFFLSCDRGA